MADLAGFSGGFAVDLVALTTLAGALLAACLATEAARAVPGARRLLAEGALTLPMTVTEPTAGTTADSSPRIAFAEPLGQEFEVGTQQGRFRGVTVQKPFIDP